MSGAPKLGMSDGGPMIWDDEAEARWWPLRHALPVAAAASGAPPARAYAMEGEFVRLYVMALSAVALTHRAAAEGSPDEFAAHFWALAALRQWLESESEEALRAFLTAKGGGT